MLSPLRRLASLRRESLRNFPLALNLPSPRLYTIQHPTMASDVPAPVPAAAPTTGVSAAKKNGKKSASIPPLYSLQAP